MIKQDETAFREGLKPGPTEKQNDDFHFCR
jgi:hypothetical protein